MKIIKEGQLPQERLYVCTCDNCKTEFSFHQKEGKVVHDQRDGPYITIACPLCQQSVTTSTTNWRT